MKGETLIITGLSCVVGLGEALIYYNMGQSALKGQGFKFKLPPGKEFLKTASVVLVTSFVTALLFKGVEWSMTPAEDKKKKQTS